ncbi:MAG: hypothetical protein K9J13_16070 [Saprospiraceae bacterium]|nr:hypothetical protein [Saprospiraceae bacterium]
MKTLVIILISSLLLLNTWTVNSQSFEPKQSTVEHNKAIRPCIVVNIDPEPKTLKKAWVKFLKKEYHFKLKGKGLFNNKELLSTKEVRFEQLSSKQLDFYTQIVEDENGSEMKVFVSLGYDIYLNEQDYPGEFKLMNDMLVAFLKQYLPVYYKKDIKDSAKKVKKLKKEIASLNRNKKRNIEKIESLTKEVEKNKTSVESNSEKLVVAEEKLKAREEKLERIRSKLQAL